MASNPNSEFSMFGGDTPEEIRHNQLLYYEGELLSDAIIKVGQLTQEGARHHLHRGFVRRLLMMQAARRDIREQTIDRDDPMDSYAVVGLNLLLNAYYLNLVGALDNLAWAITYELGLLEEVDERARECQRFCNLLGAEFRKRLKERRPSAVEILDRADKWIRDVREFRDPAAHRLPLTVIPQILLQDDIEEYQGLLNRAQQALEGGDSHEYASLKHQSRTVGRFLPILEEPRGPEGQFVVAPNAVAIDQERFISLASSLIREAF